MLPTARGRVREVVGGGPYREEARVRRAAFAVPRFSNAVGLIDGGVCVALGEVERAGISSAGAVDMGQLGLGLVIGLEGGCCPGSPQGEGGWVMGRGGGH